MAILGLMGTEQFESERFKSVRRSVFYFYPNGAAPLTGLLSLIKENKVEDVNDPEFSWYEKRLKTQSTTTAQNAQAPPNGPFLDASGANALADASNLSDSTLYRVQVASTADFRVGHVIRIASVPNAAASATYDIIGVVSIVDAANLQLQFRPIKAYASVSNDSDANSLQVLVIGSAHAQGAIGSSLAPYNLPTSFGNACQIFRTSFSMTGTALKTAAKFDETGPYKDKAKEASVDHMIEMERAYLFGEYSKSVNSLTNLPTYTTGGVLWFLKQWELGTVYGNSPTAITADADDQKRIIENAGGLLSEKTYDGYLERVFRVTNNRANEKLVLCGSGFLSVINQLYKSKSVLNSDLPLESTYGMNVVQHRTPFGDIFYKSHPLFSQDPTGALRHSALFLDIQNLVYNYMDGRDTQLLKNRQENDADYRKDEWLSECGLELRFPESHMFLKNVLDYAP